MWSAGVLAAKVAARGTDSPDLPACASALRELAVAVPPFREQATAEIAKATTIATPRPNFCLATRSIGMFQDRLWPDNQVRRYPIPEPHHPAPERLTPDEP